MSSASIINVKDSILCMKWLNSIAQGCCYPRYTKWCYPGSILVSLFLHNGVSISKSDSKQDAPLPTKGDLKPASYLCSTQKTSIPAKKTQMGMFRLGIQHYMTTASNLQNKSTRSKATRRNPQINQDYT